MIDQAMERLIDFHRRRYWLTNGWCIRFRVERFPVTEGRPHGIKYSFTLHDSDMTRLLGFDNAHGMPRRIIFDHRHRFRHVDEMVSYDFETADTLLSDFFAEVERVCKAENVPFTFDDEETEMEDGENGEAVSS